MKRKIPFSIDRNAAGSLVDKVADGIRQAILSGAYRGGDTLPSREEIAEALGVSTRVPREACTRLIREGFLISRPRIGVKVLARGARIWRGRILFVIRDTMATSYYGGVLANELRKRFVRAGYLFSCVTLGTSRRGVPELQLLDIALSQSADLVIVNDETEAIVRRVSSSGVPFVVFGYREHDDPGCQGVVRQSIFSALPEVAKAFAAAGVRHVTQFSFSDDSNSAVGELKRRGIETETVWLHPEVGFGIQETLMRLAQAEVIRRYGKGRLPEAFLFLDDFIAVGALTGLLSLGYVAPRNFRCATLANTGFGPVYPVSLARMEIDPRDHAEKLAAFVLAHLAGDPIPAGASIGARFVPGESL